MSDAASTVSRRTTPRLKRAPSLQLTLSKTKSRSAPADAATTRVHATPEVASRMPKSPYKIEEADKRPRDDRNGGPQSKTVVPSAESDDVSKISSSDPAELGSESAHSALDPKSNQNVTESRNSGAWLGWLGLPGGLEHTKISPESDKGAKPKTPTHDTQPQAVDVPGTHEPAVARTLNDTETQEKSSPPKRTWLQMWGNDPARSDKPVDGNGAEHTTIPVNKALQIPTSKNASTSTLASATQSKASSFESGPPPQLPGDGSKSSAWVFWGRDKKPDSSASSDPNVGEIAISNTPSQGRPKRASISLQDPERPKVSASSSIPPTQESIKAPKPQGKDNRPGTPIAKSQEPKPANLESSAIKNKASEPSSAAQLSASAVQLQKTVPNNLLPSFKDTYSLHESPTLLQQLARLLYYTKVPALTHVDRVREPPKIRRAIAIGVHGYFPAPLIRSVLGQPTGTSIKFANMAAQAIGKWTQSQGYSCEVKTAALEGEGKIAERVDLLWKLLLNWIDEIRKADFILVACHSQGVPVAMMLVAKLIDFGCFSSSSVKIGVCAMAGVSMGPFVEFKSRWISGSAGELFEFSDPSSTVSKSYLAALETVLKFGTRISFVGSIDDQLVSLESSIFAPISHPHIYRAVFIDGRVHAPNFIVHLVGFVLKLRNLGVPDHGLIRELSSPLAGSLYGGEGHSRIYEDEGVYELAVEFALETTTMNNIPVTQRKVPTSSSNPYILPFAMRGILEEDYVKTELHNEALELLKQFDDWRPTTKALKDVRYRLECLKAVYPA